MVTEQRELPPGLFPSEFGLQFMLSRRMGKETMKAITADIIFEMEPDFVGVSSTPDSRAVKVTFVWTRHTEDEQDETIVSEKLTRAAQDIVQRHFPTATLTPAEKLEDGAEFNNPTYIRD